MGSLPVWAHTFLLGPAALVLPLQTRDFANTYFTSKWVTFATESGFAFVSLLFLFCAVIFSFLKVRRFRESLAETKRQIMFRRKFLTPVVWRDAYRRSLSRKLDRNPFTWLEYRTAWSRAARLFMLMIALCFETALLQQPFASEDFLTFHFLVLLPLLLFLTLKSTSSFHNERESGAFELLMVTPLTERRIVNGRLKAVAGYFAPTILVLACFALLGFYGNQTFRREPNQLVAAVHLTTLSASFFSVPICGLFFALRSRTFFPALLWTTGIGILAPICLWHAFNGLVWMFARQQGSTLNLLALQLELALQRVWWPVLLSVLAYHILLALSAHKSVVRLLARRQFGTAAV